MEKNSFGDSKYRSVPVFKIYWTVIVSFATSKNREHLHLVAYWVPIKVGKYENAINKNDITRLFDLSFN